MHSGRLTDRPTDPISHPTLRGTAVSFHRLRVSAVIGRWWWWWLRCGRSKSGRNELLGHSRSPTPRICFGVVIRARIPPAQPRIDPPAHQARLGSALSRFALSSLAPVPGTALAVLEAVEWARKSEPFSLSFARYTVLPQDRLLRSCPRKRFRAWRSWIACPLSRAWGC